MKSLKFSIFILSAVIVFFTAASQETRAKDVIQVKGSDSEVNLVQRLAELFMQKSPGVNIAVTGGGSGTGIAALINKQTDIANSSRELNPKEEQAAKAAGVEAFRVVFATDGISVITHPSNPVSKLTLEQIGKIFKGAITNWKEVGGVDVKISLYGRRSNEWGQDLERSQRWTI